MKEIYMFKLATNEDFLNLKMISPGDIFPENNALEWKWGLKSFGYMFVLNEVEKLSEKENRPIILEAGMGLGNILYNKISSIADFIGLDKAGFYDKESFAMARDNAPVMQFVNGFLGEFIPDINDKSVDMTCSISILEHIPLSEIVNVVSDAARITKPGGKFVHTVDVNAGKDPILWETYRSSLLSHGFEFDEPPQKIDFSRDGLLYEPLSIVFRTYASGSEYQSKVNATKHNHSTIAIKATLKSNAQM